MQNCKNKIIAVSMGVAMIGGLGVVVEQTASAMMEAEDGQQWWSADELVEKAKEEYKTECLAGDWECANREYMQKAMEDPEFLAMTRMFMAGFEITRINVADQTLSLVYEGTQWDLKRMGEDVTLNLEEIWIGWSESGRSLVPDIVTMKDFEGFKGEDVILGYYGSSKLDGENWLPRLEEVKITATGAFNGEKLTFVMDSENGGRSYGDKIYQSCLEDENYKDGMDCQLMVTARGQRKYMPTEKRVEVEDELETNVETEEEIKMSEPEGVGLGGGSGLDEATERVDQKYRATDKIVPKTPNTGVGEQGCARQNILAVMIFCGVAAFLVCCEYLWCEKVRKNQKSA